MKKPKPYKFHANICSTGGNGLWSKVERDVDIHGLSVSYIDSDLNMVNFEAHFTKKSWNVEKHGLVYTDKLWIRQFRKEMIGLFGISKKCADDIDYTEQGMQGDNYISLGTGKKGSLELIKRFMDYGLISFNYKYPKK